MRSSSVIAQAALNATLAFLRPQHEKSPNSAHRGMVADNDLRVHFDSILGRSQGDLISFPVQRVLRRIPVPQ